MNDILWKSDVISRTQDLTQLDSASESKKKEPITTDAPNFVVSCAVQKGPHASWL